VKTKIRNFFSFVDYGDLRMKKSLIALAALATVATGAQAQSSVELYGRIDQGYNKVEGKAPNGSTLKSTNTGLDGGIGGSRLGFKGTEDLGGGLKAGFVIEFGVDMGEDVGANKTRLGFAQLESRDLGTVRVGRQVSPVKAVLDAFRPLSNNTNFRPGDFYYSGTRTLVDATDTTGYLNADQRVSNAITYITPTFAGFSAQYQTAEVSNNSGTGTNTASIASATDKAALNSGDGQAKTTGASLNYAAGNFAAAYAMLTLKTKAAGVTTIDEDIATFAATYDFGVAKLHALHSTNEIKASGVKVRDGDLTTVGVTVPVKNWVFTAEYADGSDKAFGNDLGTDVDGYKVRAMYNLSKRTGVYAQLGESKYKSKNVGQGTYKLEGYNIGVAHTF
jgi:predicted porin